MMPLDTDDAFIEKKPEPRMSEELAKILLLSVILQFFRVDQFPKKKRSILFCIS